MIFLLSLIEFRTYAKCTIIEGFSISRWQKGITYSRMKLRRKATRASSQGFINVFFIVLHFFSGHALQMNAPAESLNQPAAQRSHRHHGNVHGVFQRPRHQTICRKMSINFKCKHYLIKVEKKGVRTSFCISTLPSVIFVYISPL